MKWIFPGLLACALAVAAAAQTPHLTDPGKLLPAGPAWTRGVEAKLTAFERNAGIRILVEFHLKSPAAEEDKVPGAYMSALSRQLGTLQRGVLVVYFGDDPDWRVWIGDDLAAKFVGRPGSAKELTASGAIHEVKEAMLTAARAQADAAFAALQKAASADQPPGASQHLALQTDALLGALMAKLGPG